MPVKCQYSISFKLRSDSMRVIFRQHLQTRISNLLSFNTFLTCFFLVVVVPRSPADNRWYKISKMSVYHGKIIFSCITVAFISFLISQRFTFRASRILSFETEKCPFCFSETLCESLTKVDISASLAELIIGYFNRKYVFFGYYDYNQSIVIKRLAFEQEIRHFDTIVTNNLVENSVYDEDYFHKESVALLSQSFTDEGNKLRLCPTFSNVHLLFERMRSRDELTYKHVWTSLNLNPEPLMLRAFNFEDGWPVPKYFGACGRIVIVENSGKPIRHYWNHPWLFRVHILERLLSMAYNLSLSDPNFGIYLKDVSPDNFVINGNIEPRLVDLEHIIIVDRTTPLEYQPPSWNIEHKSEHSDCENCLTYSPLEICSHRLSDHNLYAVCKEFLSSNDSKNLGLLHSYWKLDHVAEYAEKLKFYVGGCIEPLTNTSRFEIVKQFIMFLQEIKRDNHFDLNAFKKLT